MSNVGPLTALLGALWLPSSLVLAAEAGSDVDPLALAAVLLEGGHAERAAQVLLSVDPDEERIDRPRLYTLRGLAALQQERFVEAARDLSLAVKLDDEPDPALHVYLAKARFGADDSAGALLALDSARARVEGDSRLRWLRAECLLRSGRDGEALAELRSAHIRFPDAIFLRERELQLLVEKGLFHEAGARAEPLLRHGERDPLLRLLDSLRRAGAVGTAAHLGAQARLLFPHDAELLVALAHVEVAGDRPLSAARLLEEAARHDARWAADAAELYRRARKPRDALRVGAAVLEPDKKMKQRFGLLLEERRYEEAASFAPRLKRLGLLDDDEVVHGLAYALFRTRRLDDAERMLTRVDDPALFRARTELARAIEGCRAEEWRCQ